RRMGLHTVMFLGTQPLGSLVLGALAQRFGAPGAALVSGGVSLAAAGRLALRLRRVALRERAAAGAPGMPRPRVSTDCRWTPFRPARCAARTDRPALGV